MSLISANLTAFMAIVQRGTVHGAADDLSLTQTGVTQRLRSLEQELNTTLFLRSRKGMRLTQEGEALLRYCQAIQDLEGATLSQIQGAARNHPVHINLAGPTSVMTARIVNQCASLYAEWPELYLNFIINDSINRLDLVRAGHASLAIVPMGQIPNEMTSKKLKPDRYVLVASAKWRGRRLSDILENEKAIDFDEGDQTTLNYLKTFDLDRQLKKQRLFTNNNEALIKLFIHAVGFGTLTQEIAKLYLDSGELITLNGGSVMEDPLALVWYPRAEMPNYLSAIIDRIK